MLQGISDEILTIHYKETRAAATDEQATDTDRRAGNSVLAITAIKQAFPVRYKEVFRDLQNSFLKLKDNYPVNVTLAYEMLSN